MKNRLIYGLIGLMLISLISIIAVQSHWLLGAIAEREREFNTHVNDALNSVNEDIEKDEAEFIFRRRFGDVDSLVKEVILAPEGDQTHIEVKIKDEKSSHDSCRESYIHENMRRNKEIRRGRMMELRMSDSFVGDRCGPPPHAIMMDRLNRQLHMIDSTLSHEEMLDHHIENVGSVMEHYTFEMMMSGNLEERIQPKELEKKLKKALYKEGIYGPFEFAVKNIHTCRIEDDFESDGFKNDFKGLEFRKKMFPHDHKGMMSFELIVKPGDEGKYVWAKVWKMAILSIAFILLIVFTFAYSLYFIFKQKRISQVKNDFINNMTHELKTPLASISLATSSINHPEIIKNPEEIKRLTQIIDTEKERINLHVERVLDTAALDSGDLDLKFEKVNICDVVNKAQKNVELTLLNVGGSIGFDCDDMNVQADSFHLTNMFTNILDNSIKYRSDKAPEINIKVVTERNKAVIKISDNGIGMSTKELKHACDTFYRAETGDIHNRKGFGLGLSYVKSIVEKHGGQIDLESKKGEGTTVKIVLPMSQG